MWGSRRKEKYIWLKQPYPGAGGELDRRVDGLGIVGVEVHGWPQQVQAGRLSDRELLVFRHRHRGGGQIGIVPKKGAARSSGRGAYRKIRLIMIENRGAV